MNFSLKYMQNGQEVSREQWIKGLTEKALDVGASRVQEAIANLRCEEHDQSPQVVLEKTDAGANMKFSSCCEKLKSQVSDKLTELGARPRGSDA